MSGTNNFHPRPERGRTSPLRGDNRGYCFHFPAIKTGIFHFPALKNYFPFYSGFFHFPFWKYQFSSERLHHKYQVSLTREIIKTPQDIFRFTALPNFPIVQPISFNFPFFKLPITYFPFYRLTHFPILQQNFKLFPFSSLKKGLLHFTFYILSPLSVGLVCP